MEKIKGIGKRVNASKGRVEMIEKDGINESYMIRQEREEEFHAVEALIKRAFWNLYIPGCEEHYLAHSLRGHEDFIKELSLVVEDEKTGVVGSVMYTKAQLIDEEGRRKDILTFGPVAIEPVYQRKGYGKKLLERSFEIAEEMGYDVIVIFGNPDNYVARGFKSCMKYQVCLEGDVYPMAMMVKELKEGVLDGKKWYYKQSPAFEMDMAGYEEFDRTHEAMMPGYQPSQEAFYIHSHSTLNRSKEG